MNSESLKVICERVNADEYTLEISNDAMVELFNSVELKEDDFLALSAALGKNALPDQRIKIFETLATMNDEAMPAYLYTLFDLEMLAPADEILENSQSEEFINFKAYRALKECNRHYNIDLFLPASCPQ